MQNKKVEKKDDVDTLKKKYWAWCIGMKGILGIACVFIVSEGIRLVVPQLAQRISEWIPFLGHYEETRSIDAAPFLGIFFVIATWVSIHVALDKFLRLKGEQIDAKPGRDELVIYILGGVIVFSDCLLFYTAITRTRWGDSFFSITSFIATLAYLGVLIFVSYVAIKLQMKIEEQESLKEEIKQAEQEIQQPQSAVRVL